MKIPKLNLELQNKIKELEDIRFKNKKKSEKYIAISVAIVVIEYVLFMAFHFSFYIILATAILLLIAYFFVVHSKVKSRFKEEVLSPLINSSEDINYSSSDSISMLEFHESGLFNTTIDRYSGEDLFYGKKGETSYKFSEIHAEEKHTTIDSKGKTKTTYDTIFKGVFLIADFNKKLKYSTKVIESGGDFLANIFFKKTKVNLENPTFEKIFNTYSENQIEARYIMTPNMMERILKFRKEIGRKIAISFKGNNIYIAITSYDNYFEINENNKIDNAQIEKIYRDIENFLQIIDILDLNTRIWTK